MADVGLELEPGLDEHDRPASECAGDDVTVGEPVRLAALQVAREAQDDRLAAGDVDQRRDDRAEVRRRAPPCRA